LKLPKYYFEKGILIRIKDHKLIEKDKKLYADLTIRIYPLWKYGIYAVSIILSGLLLWGIFR
jgi:hypothetical protein